MRRRCWRRALTRALSAFVGRRERARRRTYLKRFCSIEAIEHGVGDHVELICPDPGHIEAGTNRRLDGISPTACFLLEKRSCSTAATISPSTMSAAEGSCQKEQLMPRTSWVITLS